MKEFQNYRNTKTFLPSPHVACYQYTVHFFSFFQIPAPMGAEHSLGHKGRVVGRIFTKIRIESQSHFAFPKRESLRIRKHY